MDSRLLLACLYPDGIAEQLRPAEASGTRTRDARPSGGQRHAALCANRSFAHTPVP